MEKFLLFVAVAACCVACIIATEVNQCNSGLPLPHRVDVLGCDKGPCKLSKGTKVFLNVTFDAPSDMTMFGPKIVAQAIGVNIDYPVDEPNGCKQLIDAACPLEEGQRVLYSTFMAVASYYPNINFGIEMTLYAYNANDEMFPFTCYQIDGKVVD